MSSYAIVSFYKFFPLTDDGVKALETSIYALEKRFEGLRGLSIIGREGMNSTFSLPAAMADDFRSALVELTGGAIAFKNSFAEKHVFREHLVKVRPEIVTIERPDLVPTDRAHHLSPEEWHRVMTEENPVVVDTRNSYEYEVGHFAGAIDPKIEEFNEFPVWVKNSGLPKDQKVLIYCTGGIRCEKAILDMHEQGYKNVYQLDGGILNYIEKFPNQKFEGDCFVFDYRIAVDQHLRPTTEYKLCPHCGLPAKTAIHCVQCGVQETVCDACLQLGETEALSTAPSSEGVAKDTSSLVLAERLAEQNSKKNPYRTCSKNCAHHARLGHRTKRIHKDAWNRRHV
jgi:UPF0176 protein